MTLDERIEAAARAISLDYADGDYLDDDEREEVRLRAEKAIRSAFPEIFSDVAEKSRQGRNKDRDFGDLYALHENVLLGCNAVAPNLSMQELTMAFEDAKKQAKPGDNLSANPGKWPDVRGVKAVVDMMLDAIYGKDQK